MQSESEFSFGRALLSAVFVGLVVGLISGFAFLGASHGGAGFQTELLAGFAGFVIGAGLMAWLSWSRGLVLSDFGRLLSDLWDQFGKSSGR